MDGTHRLAEVSLPRKQQAPKPARKKATKKERHTQVDDHCNQLATFFFFFVRSS